MGKGFPGVWLLLMQCLCLSRASFSELNNSDPKFSGPINNSTVPVGRDALLTCIVHDLVSFKVAWLRVDTQTILSIQNHVITKNHRIAISHTEHRIWQLKIRDVQESDRGWYMCQINTDPMKSQMGYLDVVVPPDIVDYQTSQDVVRSSGQNVTLTCSATGVPQPTITWRREGSAPLLLSADGDRKMYSVEGQNLTLWQVQRDHMGAYLCIASNGVPPTVSKRVMLVVNFAPTIWTRYDTIYVGLGQKLTLECITESQPASVNFWLKDSELLQGGSYESDPVDHAYRIVMRITLRPITKRDFGEYKCRAKNAMGQTDRIITVHHKAKKHGQHSHQTSSRESQFIVIEEYIASVSDKSCSSRPLWIIFLCFVNKFSSL
ncbi:opioid-binding protein/cell adhesion molecule homolog [Drosophila gunungcola]|uniref:opioid-binding protein/cell adhesion molecule homolog n=1 Tax=Drosophila gunungcola TaxID=103775 RepID=UPI0022E85ACA|nr:opioid-binding protein/cell adhesion molecule homolog [Drosophila gunungcola]